MNVYTKNSFFDNKEINILLKNNEAYFDFILSGLEVYFDKINTKNTMHCKEFQECSEMLENKIYKNPNAEVVLGYNSKMFLIEILNNDSKSKLSLEIDNFKKKIDRITFKFKESKKEKNEFGEKRIFLSKIDSYSTEVMFRNVLDEEIYINLFYSKNEIIPDIITLSNDRNPDIPERKYKNHDMVKEIREYILYANNANAVNDLLDIEKLTTDNKNPVLEDMLKYFNCENCLDVIIKNEFKNDNSKKTLYKKIKKESL